MIGRAPDRAAAGSQHANAAALPAFGKEPASYFHVSDRPRFRTLVADGTLPPGLAGDDFAAVHLVDGAFEEAVASRAGASAYRVDRADGGVEETRLPTRLLG